MVRHFDRSSASDRRAQTDTRPYNVPSYIFPVEKICCFRQLCVCVCVLFVVDYTAYQPCYQSPLATAVQQRCERHYYYSRRRCRCITSMLHRSLSAIIKSTAKVDIRPRGIHIKQQTIYPPHR